MNLPNFTNLSLDRCFFSNASALNISSVVLVFNGLGIIVDCARKFSSRVFLVVNPLLFTRINYFLNLSLFPTDESATSFAD
ncbi:MAG: hypothetical protein V7K39_22860 [Nostoc sp.]